MEGGKKVITVICTGNICRSPMAELLARAKAAARLKCDPSELEDRGLMILSAGIAATSGTNPART